MAEQKCPLCGGVKENGVCSECGFEAPDEEEMLSVFSRAPAETGEEHILREVFPEIDGEEIYPEYEYAPAESYPAVKVAEPDKMVEKSVKKGRIIILSVAVALLIPMIIYLAQILLIRFRF